MTYQPVSTTLPTSINFSILEFLLSFAIQHLIIALSSNSAQISPSVMIWFTRSVIMSCPASNTGFRRGSNFRKSWVRGQNWFFRNSKVVAERKHKNLMEGYFFIVNFSLLHMTVTGTAFVILFRNKQWPQGIFKHFSYTELLVFINLDFNLDVNTKTITNINYNQDSYKTNSACRNIKSINSYST